MTKRFAVIGAGAAGLCAAKQFPDSPRYGLERDPHRYRRLLARDYKNSKAA